MLDVKQNMIKLVVSNERIFFVFEHRQEGCSMGTTLVKVLSFNKTVLFVNKPGLFSHEKFCSRSASRTSPINYRHASLDLSLYINCQYYPYHSLFMDG